MKFFSTNLVFLIAFFPGSLFASLDELERSSVTMMETIRKTRWEETTELFRADIATKAEKALAQIASTHLELAQRLDTMSSQLRTTDEERGRLVESFRDAQTHDHHFPTTITLLRAHTLEHHSEPTQAFLEVLVANIRLIHYQLVFSHALSLSSSLGRIPITYFQTEIMGMLHTRLALLKTIFPDFPTLSYGSLRSLDGPISQPKLTDALSRLLVGFFEQPVSDEKVEPPTAPKNVSDRTRNAILMTEDTVMNIEGYYLGFYPQSYRTDALNHLAGVAMEVPGLRECINLSRGLSDLNDSPVLLNDFEGDACDFKSFGNALSNYVGFYRANEGWMLLPLLRNFFLTASDSHPGSDPATLRSALGEIVLEYATPALKTRWPSVESALFDDSKFEHWTQVDALTLDSELKDVLKKSGIDPIAGFDVDYSENIAQAEHLLTHLKKFDPSKPIVSISSQTQCTPFLDGHKSQERAIQILREAVTEPIGEASSVGFSRLVTLYEVRIGNLYSIQNTEPVHSTLAGLLQSTVLSQLLANAVQTEILLGRSGSSTPEGLGINIPKTAYLHNVNETYQFSDPSLVMRQAATFANQAVTTEFRVNYRKQMLQAAQEIQKLDALITKLNTRGEAARQAPPGLARILNIPVEFTGEFDKNQKSQINQSLIDLADYVRWDYVKRKNIGKSIRELRQINGSTRLTIDQFKEQIDWYRGIENGRVVRPPRYTDFIGREELRLLQEHPVFQGFLLTHVHDILEGPRDYATWVKQVFIARWPMLTFVNPRSGKKTDLWRTYKDSDFENVLQSHLSMIVSTMNQFLEQEELDFLFDQAIPNHSLIDFVLRRHPDQKRAVCLEQKRIDQKKARREKVVMALSSLALALSFVPSVGAGAAFIPGVIAVGMTAYDEASARRVLAQAHAYQIASLAQRADTEHDTAYLREAEDQYFGALLKHAASIAALATGGTVRFAKMTKILGSFERSMRYSQLSTFRFARQWGSVTTRPMKLPLSVITTQNRALRFGLRTFEITSRTLNTVGKALLYPFHRLGLTAAHTREWQLFSKLSPGLARWRQIGTRVWHGVEDTSHVIVNLPLLPFGAQFGTGTAAKYLGLYGLVELGNWSLHSWKAYKNEARQLTIAGLNQKLHNEEPQPGYAQLLNAVYDGSLTIDDAADILERDERFGYQATLTQLLDEAKKSNPDTMEQLRTMQTTLEATLKSTDDPNHAIAIKRAISEIRSALTLVNAQK